MVVLDTDVASRLIHERLTGPLAERLPEFQQAVTFVTVGELWKWAEIRRWGPRKRQHLRTWLSRMVILPSSTRVSRTWGRAVGRAQLRGRTPQTNDSWIAASCLARGLPLATLNTKDFTDLADHEGLTLLGA